MKQLIKRLSIILLLLIVSVRIIIFFLPAPPLLNGISFSSAIYDEHHQLLRLTLSQDAKYRLYVPLSAMSPSIIAVTLLQEDQYFRWHAGVNPLSLVKAMWQTYGLGSRRIGASTITMQVARMRFGMNSKTFSGKISQIMRALQLETTYSKDQILEAYLNLAPYGNNIEGVGAASLIYFAKSARALPLPEALALAVIPQNPTKRVPNRGMLKEIRYKLFLRWIALHAEDKNKKSLIDLPLQMLSVHSAPFFAPHFVNEVLSHANRSDNQIITTLDLRLQKIITRVTRNYLARKKNLNVTNAAVLVVDTRDMGIKALLGSANYFNQAISGQINGTDVKRSPGSALKPFIYVLALDQGIIHPATVLKDVPHSFRNYNPENFDNDFSGPIKAKEALILSRNIPAVYLAEQLKHPSLYEFLQAAHVSELKAESYYGLALALGGAEMTMQELVSLYAALANAGLWKPLRFTGQSTASKKLLSPEASFLVLDMLQETTEPNHALAKINRIPVAWKTGTSSGYRDAWTVGIFGPYVMAVWIGNFNNQSNPAFVGKEIAAPLFFEIAGAMNTQLGPLVALRKYPDRMHLTKVEVCKASGMLPTRYCPDTEPVWFMPGKSPIKTDTIHREIAINTVTGLRACKFDQHTRFEVYEFWSSDLLQIFKRAGIQRRIPPPYDPSCTFTTKVDMGLVPQIISPQEHLNYVARLATEKQTIIPFNAVVDADARNLHWFVNETFIGKNTRDQSFLWHATPGHFTVRVVDDFGRSDAREVIVRLEN